MGELDRVAADNMDILTWSADCKQESLKKGWLVYEGDTSINIEMSSPAVVNPCDVVDECIQAALGGDILARRALAFIMENVEEYNLQSNCNQHPDFELAAKSYYGYVDPETPCEINHMGM